MSPFLSLIYIYIGYIKWLGVCVARATPHVTVSLSYIYLYWVHQVAGCVCS